MPQLSLGTCCGSDVKLGYPAWLKAGGRHIDTAFDYGGVPRGGFEKPVPGGLQSDIAEVMAVSNVAREAVFITTKVPAGLDPTDRSCSKQDRQTILKQIRQDLTELSVQSVE